jgi:very-short-patch-repair endonuclease
MWVAYSLDPSLDLKPGDLRRKLIEHALDPLARAREIERKSPRAESDFERKVLERLVASGYRVNPQYSVGAYRIDLVVEGRDGRLAVECDGERFHTPENVDEDMARQAILERLGWKFVRLRGSLFYRDPERAMRPVFERLAVLGIEPGLPEAVQGGTSDLHRRVIAKAAELMREWVRAPELAPSVEVKAAATREPRAPPWRQAKEPLKKREADVIDLAFRRADGALALSRNGPVVDLSDGVMPQAEQNTGQIDGIVVNRPVGAKSATGTATRRETLLLLLGKQQLPADRCPICAAPVAVRISSYGPYLPCTTASCKGKYNVEFDVVRAAVADLDIKCECGGTFVLRKGRTTFLGCNRYPACKRTIWWTDL